MDSIIFISLVIVAITQVIKMVAPRINGVATIIVAFAVGILVALLDTYIGVADISIAQGIMSALQAVGLSTLAGKAGGGAPGDNTPVLRQNV